MKGKKGVDKKRHSEQCTICRDSDKRALVESLYVNRRTFAEIAEEGDTSIGALQRHFKAFPDLLRRRQDNIEGISQLIVEKGLEALQRGEMKISPALFAESIKTLAKLKGLFIDRTMDLTATLGQASDKELDFFEKMGRLPEKGELTEH